MAKGKLLLGLDIGSNSAKMCLLRDVQNAYAIEVADRELLPADAIVDGDIEPFGRRVGVAAHADAQQDQAETVCDCDLGL